MSSFLQASPPSGIGFLEVQSCPICDSGSISRVAYLPGYPLTEFFSQTVIDEGDGYRLDQALLVCENCAHVFLERQIESTLLYGNHYQTRSAGSSGSVKALERLVHFMQGFEDIGTFDLCIDVGANDGTLLKKLPGYGFMGRRVGIDPSSLNWSDGIEGHTCFAEEVDFNSIVSGTDAALLIASHVLEHVSDPVGLFRTLASSMRSRDRLLVQFPALEPMGAQLRFDQVHHQHYHYFSWSSFREILRLSGLEAVAVDIDWDHYGSATCLLKRSSRSDLTLEVNAWNDAWTGLGGLRGIAFGDLQERFQTFVNFQKSVDLSLTSTSFLALGAGLMSPIVFYHLPRGRDNCISIIDDDEDKWGRRYCGTPSVIGEVPKSLSGKTVLISGAVSKIAGRALTARAFDLDARSVVVPILNI